ENGALETDGFSFLVEGVLLEQEKTGADHAAEQVLERFAVGKIVRAGLFIKLAGGLAVAPAQGLENFRQQLLLQRIGLAEAAHHAFIRRADVAQATWFA